MVWSKRHHCRCSGDVWHSVAVDFGCVNSRILSIKFKFSRIKVCVVVEYGPNDGDGEKWDRFWNDMERTLGRVGNEYRLCIPGYLNVWIGDWTRAGITGAFGVPGEKYNNRREVDFCSEREVCVGKPYFKKRSLHKYTRVVRGQDGGSKDNDISSVGEEGYNVICERCESSKRNGARPFRPPYCTV